MHKTKNLNDRYFGSGKRLTNAIKCHGIENFIKEILYVFDTEEKMKLAEKILVVLDKEVSYNLCPGGRGGFGYINSTTTREEKSRRGFLSSTKEAKLKVSQAVRLRFSNPKTRKSLSDKMKVLTAEGIIKLPNWSGKKHTEETKEKMRKPKNIGSQNSQFGSMWITNGLINMKIKKSDVIPDGWYNGRIIKSS
jgi:hypothetical protein